MTTEQIKDALRQAVRDRVLYGWYKHDPFNGYEWCVVPDPADGLPMQYTSSGIEAFVEMLEAAV